MVVIAQGLHDYQHWQVANTNMPIGIEL